jgi:hypothetical protein
MFHPERDMREIIFEILRSDGKSISAISRELEEKGFDIHRLILTGYLRALTDLNVLKVKDIPPAKVYFPIGTKEPDIYNIVGDNARLLCPDGDADILAIYSLGKLFRRPIFIDEVRRCGFKEAPVAKMVTGEDRQEARKVLTKAGFKIPDSSPAFIVEGNALESRYEELLAMVISSLLDISHLTRETKQTKLSLDNPARK